MVSDEKVLKRGYAQTGNNESELLYVVDNQIHNNISWIPPCRIRSIQVLEGLTDDTDIYGEKGKHGVIKIETKSVD